MKRTFYLLISLLTSIITITGCTSKYAYSEQNLIDSCYWNGQEIVSMDIQYPQFEGSNFINLNAVISTKMQEFENQYDMLCNTRKVDCDNDHIFAKLKCYIDVSYTVTIKSNKVLITFSVCEFGGGAAEHGYTENIVYNVKTQQHSEIKSDFY
jgi:hypothetical protein